MIEISHLTKRYGRTLAVDDLSFTAAAGQVTAFLGPNGAGKSTTLRVLMGLDAPTSGRALLGGVPYRRLHRPLTTAGALLDGAAAHPGRTAAAHLTWLAQSNAIPVGRVGEVLELVGLAPVAGRQVGTYSLGMGQRLGIAAALLGDPRVLVLDEPVNGLDPEGVVWIRTLLRDLADRGRTVLVSSHLMGEVAQLADHLVVVSAGRLCAAGPLPEVVAGYASLEEAFFALTGPAAQYTSAQHRTAGLGGLR